MLTTRSRAQRSLLAVVSACAFLVPTGLLAAPRPSMIAPSAGGPSLFLCGTEVAPSELGWIQIPPFQGPAPQFTAHSGLWVGARVDTGESIETRVSTGYFGIEFGPETPPVSGTPAYRIVYTDASDAPWIPEEHRPLGVRVVQHTFERDDPVLEGVVQAKFEIENISAEVDPPGLTWENVYIGILMDPDVGAGEDFTWTDDHAGFAAAATSDQTGPPGARHGDLAYAWDELGSGDDTLTQVGIVLLGQRAHRFRRWSGGAQDPMNDVQRYQAMRGTSDTEPTIDPPTTRSDDQRILLAVGPIPSLAPGERTTFGVEFVCGDLVPDPPARPGAPVSTSPFATADAWDAVRVAPNPVYLSGDRATGRDLRFMNLPDGSEVWVYSIDGRLIRALDARGVGEVGWNLRDERGETVPGGIYFYRVAGRDAAAGEKVGKLVVIP